MKSTNIFKRIKKNKTKISNYTKAMNNKRKLKIKNNIKRLLMQMKGLK